MKKNGLNVEHFRYHITITMIKVHQHALINQMLYQKNKKIKIATKWCAVRPTEKVSRTSATSGKNESRALEDIKSNAKMYPAFLHPNIYTQINAPQSLIYVQL